VTENTGSFIACAALEFPVASKSIVAQSFPKVWENFRWTGLGQKT